MGYSSNPAVLADLWYTWEVSAVDQREKEEQAWQGTNEGDHRSHVQVCRYNYSAPGFTAGHFTQLVRGC